MKTIFRRIFVLIDTNFPPDHMCSLKFYTNRYFSAKNYTNSQRKLIIYFFKKWHYDAKIKDVYFCLTPPSPLVYKRLFLTDPPPPMTDDVFYECRLKVFFACHFSTKNIIRHELWNVSNKIIPDEILLKIGISSVKKTWRVYFTSRFGLCIFSPV